MNIRIGLAVLDPWLNDLRRIGDVKGELVSRLATWAILDGRTGTVGRAARSGMVATAFALSTLMVVVLSASSPTVGDFRATGALPDYRSGPSQRHRAGATPGIE